MKIKAKVEVSNNPDRCIDREEDGFDRKCHYLELDYSSVLKDVPYCNLFIKILKVDNVDFPLKCKKCLKAPSKYLSEEDLT